MKPTFKCLDCGACCSCVEVQLADGDAPPIQFVDLAHRRMRIVPLTDGRCVALAGEVGRRGIRCGCYDQRPRVCREVKRGDPMCLAARFHCGLPGGVILECVARDLAARHSG